LMALMHRREARPLIEGIHAKGFLMRVLGFCQDVSLICRGFARSCDRGGSARSAAARFDIGVATAVRWCRLCTETVIIAPNLSRQSGSRSQARHACQLHSPPHPAPGLSNAPPLSEEGAALPGQARYRPGTNPRLRRSDCGQLLQPPLLKRHAAPTWRQAPSLAVPSPRSRPRHELLQAAAAQAPIHRRRRGSVRVPSPGQVAMQNFGWKGELVRGRTSR